MVPLEDALGNRLVQTVPAKEPHLDAMPLKSALKKNALAKAESKFHDGPASR